MSGQGQYYQQPPPQQQQPPPQQYQPQPQYPPQQQYPPGYNPDKDSIKSMVNIAGIFGILMAVISILAGIWFIWVWIDYVGHAGGYYLFISIWFIIGLVLGLLFFMNCKQINDMVDRGQYIQAKSKTLVWMIIGIIFVFFIPGILLLIAYLKFDDLIRATQPAYYPPVPQQPQYYPQQSPPQQQRTCLGCGQQIPVNYNNCPHCGKHIGQ